MFRFWGIALLAILFTQIVEANSNSSKSEDRTDEKITSSDCVKSDCQQTDDKKGEEKVEDKKPEDKKPEDKKPDDKKPDDKKPEDKKPDDKKPEDKKPEDKEPDDKKPEDKKPDDKKPDDKKGDATKKDDSTIKGKADAVEGKADLSALKTTLKDLVKSRIRSSGGLDGIKELIRIDGLGKNPEVEYLTVNNSIQIKWKVAAKKKLDDADRKKIQDDLKKILLDSLNEETDENKRLTKSSLKIAVDFLVPNAGIEISDFTKLDEIKSEEVRSYLAKSLKEKPDSLKDIQDLVVVENIGDSLIYDPETTPRIEWEYRVSAGKDLTESNKTTIKNILTGVLEKSFEATYKEDKFEESDKAIFAKYAKEATIKPFLPGLGLNDLDQSVIQKLVRSYLTATPRVYKELSEAGVATKDDVDRDYLIEHLTYEPPANDSIEVTVVLKWKYRQNGPTVINENVRKRLQDVLTNSLRPPSASEAKRVVEKDFNNYFKEAIAQLIPEPVTIYRADELNDVDAQSMIKDYVSRYPDCLKPFRNQVETGRIRDCIGFLVQNEKDRKVLRWKLLTDPSRSKMGKDAELPDTDLMKFQDEIRKILVQAILENAKNVKPAFKLDGQDREKVLDWIKDAKIEIEKVMASVDQVEKDRIERERQAAEQQRKKDNEKTLLRLDDLEDRLARLETLVQQGGGNHTAPPIAPPIMIAAPSSAACEIQYITTRAGLFGCRTVTTPVVVQKK